MGKMKSAYTILVGNHEDTTRQTNLGNEADLVL
jgi:hypothetical protein